jgi:formate hydrogenlyase subunit 4
VAPWGLARGETLGEVFLAIPFVLVKIFIFILILATVESSFAKLRLFRITEFLGAAFITSVGAMIIRLLEM